MESDAEGFEEGGQVGVEPRWEFMAPGGEVVQPALEGSFEETAPEGFFPGAPEA